LKISDWRKLQDITYGTGTHEDKHISSEASRDTGSFIGFVSIQQKGSQGVAKGWLTTPRMGLNSVTLRVAQADDNRSRF